MGRRSKPPEERKQEIVDTAARLFTERGYEQTTVREIVGELGVAQGLFYYYFKNKEEVLFAVVQQRGKQLIEQIAVIIADRQVSPLLRARMALDVISHFFYQDAALDWGFPGDLSPRMMLRFQQMTSEMLEPYLVELLSQGQQSGEFSVIHPLYTARFILSGFIGLSVNQEHPSSEEIVWMVRHMVERILSLPEGALDEVK